MLARKASTAVRQGVLLAAWSGMAGAVLSMGAGKAGAQSPRPGADMAMVYVSEVPYQWNSEMGNPLEVWSRKLSAQLALSAEATSERMKNLLPVLTWEKLVNVVRTRRDHLFAIHGYEYISHRDSCPPEEQL